LQAAVDTVLAENSSKEEEDDEDGFKAVDVYKPSPPLITIVDGLKLIMGRIFSDNLLNRNDYHVVLFESSTKAYQEVNFNQLIDNGEINNCFFPRALRKVVGWGKEMLRPRWSWVSTSGA
jgi:hypothetical protein